MPKFKIEKDSSLAPAECYSKLKTFLESDPDLQKMDSGYKCQFNDGGLSGKAKGSKFEADMKVSGSGSSSKVEITVELPLLLSPVKGMVQSTLEKKLAKILG